MTKFIQPGEILDFVAPAGGVIAGAPLFIGGFFVVPNTTAAEGETFSGAVEGAFEFDAVAADTGDTGAVVYWDADAKVITVTEGENAKVGLLTADKAANVAVALVFIRPTI